jgi:hypothetical protein
MAPPTNGDPGRMRRISSPGLKASPQSARASSRVTDVACHRPVLLIVGIARVEFRRDGAAAGGGASVAVSGR